MVINKSALNTVVKIDQLVVNLQFKEVKEVNSS